MIQPHTAAKKQADKDLYYAALLACTCVLGDYTPEDLQKALGLAREAHSAAVHSFHEKRRAVWQRLCWAVNALVPCVAKGRDWSKRPETLREARRAVDSVEAYLFATYDK